MTKCKSLRQFRPTLSWVCLFKTLHLSITNQQTAKDSVCEFKRLFWLVDGKRTPRTPAIPSHTDILLLYRERYRKLEFSLTPGCSYWDLQQHSALHKNTFCLKLLPGRRIGSKFETIFVSAAAVTDVHICPEKSPSLFSETHIMRTEFGQYDLYQIRSCEWISLREEVTKIKPLNSRHDSLVL